MMITIFDEDRYMLFGEMTGKEYRIGDIVKVRVTKTDKIARQVEFYLIGPVEEEKPEKEDKDRKKAKTKRKKSNKRKKLKIKYKLK